MPTEPEPTTPQEEDADPVAGLLNLVEKQQQQLQAQIEINAGLQATLAAQAAQQEPVSPMERMRRGYAARPIQRAPWPASNPAGTAPAERMRRGYEERSKKAPPTV